LFKIIYTSSITSNTFIIPSSFTSELYSDSFDNYEIAGIMSTGLRAVQQHRYRIKKKFNIKQRLDDFILSIN